MASKIKISFVTFVFYLSVNELCAQPTRVIPEDAQKALNELPGKTLSLPVVVSRAFQTSTSAQEIKAQFPMIEVPQLSAKAGTETTLQAELSRLRDEKESSSAFSPTRTDANVGKMGVQSLFSTGTVLSGEYSLSQADVDFNVGGAPQTSSNYESALTLSIAQNLLKDSFGSSTRKALRAGELESSSLKEGLTSAFEEWFLGVSQSYYGAWLSQEQLLAADQSLIRRQKLLNITQIRARRGTAEEPELLQIRAAVTQAALAQEESAQALQEQWRFLVISLGFPANWADIDARLIPLKFEAPLEDALKACESTPQSFEAQAAGLQSAKLQAEAAALKLDRSRNLALPELQLFASASYNGVDSTRADSVSQNLSGDHPAYAVGLKFSMPLGGRVEEVQVRSAVAEDMKARAKASAAADQYRISWANECANMKRLSSANSQLKSSLAAQIERVRLEENRFQVGRVPLINVIQAGDDSTSSRVALSVNEMNRAMSAWRIQRLSGALKAQLQQLQGAQK
jgi:outer membrane protein TolC